ncbi:nitronate monooxygenase [Chloroflexota bacterium]
MTVVGSVASAKRAEQAGADAIVAEGMESGSHIGDTTTMTLVHQVVDSVHIPVIAADGIGDGRSLAAALVLGAQVIQTGTRFLCSQECPVHIKYKEKSLEANDRSTVITGKAARHSACSLKNEFARQMLALEETGLSSPEWASLNQGKAYLGMIAGDVYNGTLLAGQVVGLVKEIKPVRTITEEIVTSAESILKQMGNEVKDD